MTDRVEQQLGLARLGPRQVGHGLIALRIGAGREQDLREPGAGRAVDHAVVDLVEQRELLAILHALDDPDLPQGSAPVEGASEDARGQLAQLLLASGLGQGDVADVGADVEVAIVDPDRPALDGGPGQALAIAGDAMQHALDGGAVAADVDAPARAAQGLRLQDGHASDVHRGGVALGHQEAHVLSRQSLESTTSHGGPLSSPPR